MNRQQKQEVVESLKTNFAENDGVFVVNFQGLTVAQMQKLRGQLRKKGGKLKVAKGRLMRRAAGDDECMLQLAPQFKGQVGLVFASDSAAIAKVLYDFSKDNEALRLIAGCMDAQLVDSEAMGRIALLPSKEVLLAQLCGGLNAPITGLVSVLSQLPTKLVIALKQIEKQKGDA